MEITIEKELDEIVSQITDGKTPSVTVRELLTWVLAERRGYIVVNLIRQELRKRNIITIPDFESVYLDSKVDFVSNDVVPSATNNIETPQAPTENQSQQDDIISIPLGRYSMIEPAYKISRLEAANRPPIYIAPDATLIDAVTLMLANGFSQLPVMTNERDVKGIISWSSIGSRMALGKQETIVKDFMEPHQEMRPNDSILSAINIINQYDYVLIRRDDRKIAGIVTASDLNYQFKQISESFMLLSEIENYIRRLIEPKFTVEILQSAKDPNDPRVIKSVSDLTFGEYIRLLEDPSRWDMLGLSISRKIFCDKVDQTRKIRNDVMHFDPDGVPNEDLKALHDFSIFLQRLHSFNLL
jgi:CBS domain-containing protein